LAESSFLSCFFADEVVLSDDFSCPFMPSQANADAAENANADNTDARMSFFMVNLRAASVALRSGEARPR
jgi:hypothetical protein